MKRTALTIALAVMTTAALIAGCNGGDPEPNRQPDDSDTGLGFEERPEPPTSIQDLEKPEFTEERVAEGKELFETLCTTCHGPEGKGDGAGGGGLTPPPQDLTNPELQDLMSDRYLYWRIMEGGSVLGYTGMQAFKGMTSAEERWSLVAYVRTLDDQEE